MSAPPVAELMDWTAGLLGKVRCRPNTERELSDAVQRALEGPSRVRGIEIAREHRYEDPTTGRRWRFDFALRAAQGLLAVEVKLNGGPAALAFQLNSYAALEGVAGLLVVTTKNSLANVADLALPHSKRLVVVNLALSMI